MSQHCIYSVWFEILIFLKNKTQILIKDNKISLNLKLQIHKYGSLLMTSLLQYNYIISF